MIGEICTETRNYFVKQKHFGKFSVVNGELPLDFLQNGQYFRVVGSNFNDGVYRYPVSDLTDEVFDGAVWSMAVPPSVIDLAVKIEGFVNSAAGKPSAYTSESFGGYSYTKSTAKNGAPVGWREVFAKELNQFRRAFVQ